MEFSLQMASRILHRLNVAEQCRWCNYQNRNKSLYFPRDFCFNFECQICTEPSTHSVCGNFHFMQMLCHESPHSVNQSCATSWFHFNSISLQRPHHFSVGIFFSRFLHLILSFIRISIKFSQSEKIQFIRKIVRKISLGWPAIVCDTINYGEIQYCTLSKWSCGSHIVSLIPVGTIPWITWAKDGGCFGTLTLSSNVIMTLRQTTLAKIFLKIEIWFAFLGRIFSTFV